MQKAIFGAIVRERTIKWGNLNLQYPKCIGITFEMWEGEVFKILYFEIVHPG